ncbi:MAG: SDR family oxidoreductase [Gammaproteobacteria bacterium]|nr:SDR family oxidoreductase [Gammaproteobacteria bacterium]
MSFRSVIIFGGDSEPGDRVTMKALANGLDVVSVVRGRRATDGPKRNGLATTLCEPADRDSVERVFADRRGEGFAVVAILGGSPQVNSQGNIHVINAAAAAGVRRLVLTTSIGCGDSAAVIDPFVKAVAGRAIRAKEWAENHLRTTDLDWTIVRAGGTTRRPGTGTAILTDSKVVTGYISLTDLGDMLWLALTSPATHGRALAAVDSARAFNIDGSPVRPVEL